MREPFSPMFSITTTMFSLRCRKKKRFWKRFAKICVFPTFLWGQVSVDLWCSPVIGAVLRRKGWLLCYYGNRLYDNAYCKVTGSNWFHSSCNSFYYFDGFSSWINARMAVCWCYSLMKKTLWKLFRWQSVLKYRSPVFFDFLGRKFSLFCSALIVVPCLLLTSTRNNMTVLKSVVPTQTLTSIS